MPDLGRLYDLDDIAAWLKVAPGWIERHIGTLCVKHGFPRALPLRGVRRWDPAALEHWLAGYRSAAPRVTVAAPVAADDAAADPVEERLAARSKALAASLGEGRRR